MDEREAFIEKAARERQEREDARRREEIAVGLQPYIRRYLVRRQMRKGILEDVQKELGVWTDLEQKRPLLPNQRILHLGLLFLRVAKFPENSDELCLLCRHMIMSLDSPSRESNIAAVFLSKSTLNDGNRLIRGIMKVIPGILGQMTGAKMSEVKCWNHLVHFLVRFSSANAWSLARGAQPAVLQVLNTLCAKMASPLNEPNNYEQLAKSLYTAVNAARPLIAPEAVSALFHLLFQRFSTTPTLSALFISKVLTCPAVLTHLSKATSDVVLSNGLLGKIVTIARKDPSIVEEVPPTVGLNFIGNILHLARHDNVALVEHLLDWAWMLNTVLLKCRTCVVGKGERSSHNHWHPVFGNFRQRIDAGTEGSLRNVMTQVELLWGREVVNCLFAKVLPCGDPSTNHDTGKTEKSSSDLVLALQKLRKKIGSLSTSDSVSEGTLSLGPISMTSLVCQVYMNAVDTLTNKRSEILSGLCREDSLLTSLWAHLCSWPSSSDPAPLGRALALMTQPTAIATPHLAPLHLFANAAASVISILDDEEIFEMGRPFTARQLASIARFTNVFCFRTVWNGIIDREEKSAMAPVFTSILHLNEILYTRDCRRSFTGDPKFWLAPDVKSLVLMNEFEKKTERGQLLLRRMSHLVNLKERMILFRRLVQSDKSGIDLPPTLITVERNRLVEDGYRQLSRIPSRALRATVRVKFINVQGMDEAGIDQDGVFKEFLELTLKQVFHPELNLFKASSNGQLYPSSTSSVHEEHLELFTFVGRMLAKAVYEGIVVDVQLAPVLLATVLGNKRLCAFDELAQLDAQLYKNLTYVKRYSDSEDVGDLSLTYSIDQDFMGKITTVDLVPGGRTIQVTNENKIDYVHRMAHYRVFTETAAQCKAFVNGFQSVINPAWLFLFAPHELQYLIAGTTTDIDMADLRKHVQYYGGFHSNHRLIKWLWQILDSDFSAEERRLFLKFVTSCSRGPLLGFGYLEPPFSIRCVEVSDDQDQGDTLASVVRGFLAIKKREAPSRLPTASTCFNLLKLPNYSKKSTLLQKLRYAIHSGTGFELS